MKRSKGTSSSAFGCPLRAAAGFLLLIGLSFVSRAARADLTVVVSPHSVTLCTNQTQTWTASVDLGGCEGNLRYQWYVVAESLKNNRIWLREKTARRSKTVPRAPLSM